MRKRFIGEMILAWIAREVPEWQHHDGKMRGVGPRCWCIRGDGRSSLRAEEIPSVAAIATSAMIPTPSSTNVELVFTAAQNPREMPI